MIQRNIKKIANAFSSFCFLIAGISTVFLFGQGCSPAFIANQSSMLDQGSLGAGVLSEGMALYQTNCASCHGAIHVSDKRNRSADRIQAAIREVAQMQAPLSGKLTRKQLEQIALALETNSNTEPTIISKLYSCEKPQERGMSQRDSRRLTKVEIQNSLTSLFGSSAINQSPAFALFPDDGLTSSVDEFRKLHSIDHAKFMFEFLWELSGSVAANNSSISSHFPSCVISEINNNKLSSTCLALVQSQVLDSVTGLATKIHRRTLNSMSADKRNLYLSVLTTDDSKLGLTSVRDRVRMLIAVMLQAPEFQYHREITVGGASGGRARVDGFTVASRLSFRILNSSPDNQLLQKAASGELLNPTELKNEANRLVNSAGARSTVRNFTKFWLRLSKITQPAGANLTRIGLPATDQAKNEFTASLVDETLDFAEFIAFDHRSGSGGNFKDLATAELSFPERADVARVLGVPATGRNIASVQTPGRAGILARPALLMTNGKERENPMHRGITARLNILCEKVPPPPMNADGVAADILKTLDQSKMTTREIAQAMTGGPSCAGCHNSLNSIGFSLGKFGPLGQLQEVETVFLPDGTTRTIPVDTRSDELDIYASNDYGSDHLDTARLLGESAKGRACFTSAVVSYMKIKSNVPEDNCLLSDVETIAVQGGTIKEMLVQSVTSEDIFYKGVN